MQEVLPQHAGHVDVHGVSVSLDIGEGVIFVRVAVSSGQQHPGLAQTACTLPLK